MKKTMKSQALRMEKEEKKGPMEKGEHSKGCCGKHAAHGHKECSGCKEDYKEDHEKMNK